MRAWPTRRLQELLHIEHPILQAPMAGSALSLLAIAVAQGGGLGALACAMLTPDRIREEVALFRAAVDRPLNLNFFCHHPPEIDPDREKRWRQVLAPYYAELGLNPGAVSPAASRNPFDETSAALVEELRPEVVSFHFGLPEASLLAQVRATSARVLCSATTVEEAMWLEAQGCDAIIAQGAEAGGHRGMFRTEDLSTQLGTLALVPQIVDAVQVPVIAAGGIADGRAIAAALQLGATGVQIGTAYLLCPEAATAPLHRQALIAARDPQSPPTALTNLFTGRPARGITNRIMRELGPISADAPAFPLAIPAMAALRTVAEKTGSTDFTALWAGQSAALAREVSALELTRQFTSAALDHLGAQ